MAIFEGSDLTGLLDNPVNADVRRHCHAVDISESIWNRMQELGMSQADLARKLGKSRSQVSRMLSVQGNMTLLTISELEHVLGITLADTTPYEPATVSQEYDEPKKRVSAWGKPSVGYANGVIRVKDWGMAA